MVYNIHVRVIQSNPSAWFSIVEKTAWDDVTWREVDGEQILTMSHSGTSGTLRFKNAHGDYFLVALGVHNYKRWCDIVLHLPSTNTGAKIHGAYYDSHSPRHQMLWKQLASLEKSNCKGLHVKVNYYKEDCQTNTLWATITIIH